MPNFVIPSLFISLVALLPLQARAVKPWTYSTPLGPNLWGTLVDSTACMHGIQQSPVDIESGKRLGLQNVKLASTPQAFQNDWKSSRLNIVNEGRTIVTSYDPGSSISLNGIRYELKQFHFHSPSEHLLDGRKFPLEVHFVHTAENQDDESNPLIAVVAVFFKAGDENPTLQKIWDHAPQHVSSTQFHFPEIKIRASDFLPQIRHTYRYEGSLTTPPCTEGVRWIIFNQPTFASPEQLSFLQKILGGPNSRPSQSLNGRQVFAHPDL